MLDKRRGSSCAGAEINVCVVGYTTGEDAEERVRDELGGRGGLEEGDFEGPGEGEAGLDFEAEVLWEPAVILVGSWELMLLYCDNVN